MDSVSLLKNTRKVPKEAERKRNSLYSLQQTTTASATPPQLGLQDTSEGYIILKESRLALKETNQTKHTANFRFVCHPSDIVFSPQPYQPWIPMLLFVVVLFCYILWWSEYSRITLERCEDSSLGVIPSMCWNKRNSDLSSFLQVPFLS